MNVYYVKAHLTIKKVALQSYIDPPAKIDWNLITFISIFEKILGNIYSFNPDFLIILGDFNARWNNWWVDDTQTSEGSQVDSFKTSYGFRQLLPEPTRIFKNSSSFIDLIFTDQPSLTIDSGTHPSLHPNCHHQIVLCETDLKIT